MKPKLYLETTIPSYLTSRPSRDLLVAANQQVTRQWWDERRNQFNLYVSQAVINEAGAGDVALANERLKVIQGLPVLQATPEAAELTTRILQLGIIPQRAATDALHIAIAAAHDVDYLMTWNCSHIANAVIIRRIAQACEEQGFECPLICTPHELLGESAL